MRLSRPDFTTQSGICQALRMTAS